MSCPETHPPTARAVLMATLKCPECTYISTFNSELEPEAYCSSAPEPAALADDSSSTPSAPTATQMAATSTSTTPTTSATTSPPPSSSSSQSTSPAPSQSPNPNPFSSAAMAKTDFPPFADPPIHCHFRDCRYKFPDPIESADLYFLCWVCWCCGAEHSTNWGAGVHDRNGARQKCRECKSERDGACEIEWRKIGDEGMAVEL